MKSKIFLTSWLLLLGSALLAQNRFIDSTRTQLHMARHDTTRVLLLSDLCYFFRYTNIDSAMYYGEKALALAEQISFKRGISSALNKLGLAYREKGDLPKSLALQYKALNIAIENNYLLEQANCYRRIGHVYRDLRDFPSALHFSQLALRTSLRIHDKRGEAIEYMNFAITYVDMGKSDSALYYADKGLLDMLYIEDVGSEVKRVLGEIYVLKGNKNKALHFFRDGIQAGLVNNDNRTLSYIYANMATMYKSLNQSDSSILCAKKAIHYGQIASYKKGILLASNLLASLYDPTDPSEALRYYRMAADAKDSLYGAGNIQTIQAIVAAENDRQKEVALAKAAYQNQLRQYGLVGGLVVFSIIAGILYRNNRQKQNANRLLEKTLSDLKSTQSQLIQSEKMASLGELTAGIAHEIQNPLNFVNNFSEVSTDLVAEMNTEIDKGNTADAKAIANDLRQNLDKINHHGKRAADIVKGMLQHSRSSSGQKELIDINELCDEYLRLAYHGLRAKDKSFNAKFETNLDPALPKVHVVPQEIGRVVLNLINNAFYAVNEKKNQDPANYEPTVIVSTKRVASPLGAGGRAEMIEIRVSDNGKGIPAPIKDKIFQPFFTTKPTGQGTGLGLSLSYDIVKAHGGELTVETKERGGSEFTLKLPNG